MPYNRKAFGIIIGRMRTERKISQENLSALAGISRSHLAMIENGKKTVRLDTFWKIADALNVKPSQLMAYVEETEQIR